MPRDIENSSRSHSSKWPGISLLTVFSSWPITSMFFPITSVAAVIRLVAARRFAAWSAESDE
jgi:hypothetical protein